MHVISVIVCVGFIVTGFVLGFMARKHRQPGGTANTKFQSGALVSTLENNRLVYANWYKILLYQLCLFDGRIGNVYLNPRRTIDFRLNPGLKLK